MIEITNDLVVCVVAHDAGAAAHIAHYTKSLKNEVVYSLEGPAIAVFEDVIGKINVVDMEAAILAADIVICGTGWQTDCEWRAIKLSRMANKDIIACVDHWTNYKSRFTRNSLELMPDEIWVFDEHAYFLAKNVFPNVAIRQRPNLYLTEQIKKIGRLDASATNGRASILYLLEPMRECWHGDVLAEFEALDNFVKHLSYLNTEGNIEIFLKPHPSDAIGKYDAWLTTCDWLDIKIVSCSLADAIARSTIVVGCRTYAMVIALHAGRKVYTAIPQRYETFRLPYTKIMQLEALAEVKK